MIIEGFYFEGEDRIVFMYKNPVLEAHIINPKEGMSVKLSTLRCKNFKPVIRATIVGVEQEDKGVTYELKSTWNKEKGFWEYVITFNASLVSVMSFGWTYELV